MQDVKHRLLRGCSLPVGAVAFLLGVLLLQQESQLPDARWALSIPLLLVFSGV